MLCTTAVIGGMFWRNSKPFLFIFCFLLPLIAVALDFAIFTISSSSLQRDLVFCLALGGGCGCFCRDGCLILEGLCREIVELAIGYDFVPACYFPA